MFRETRADEPKQEAFESEACDHGINSLTVCLEEIQ